MSTILQNFRKKIRLKLFLFYARLEIDYKSDKSKLDIPENDQYQTLIGFVVHNINETPIYIEVLNIYSNEFIVRELKNTKIEVLEMKMPN